MKAVFIWLMVLTLVFTARADELPEQVKSQAENAYQSQDFENAFNLLAEVPELLGVLPILDQPRGQDRAEIFFDLARIKLAQRDTQHARAILDYIFQLDPNSKSGVLDLAQDDAYANTRTELSRLRQIARKKHLAKTTFMGAVGRSLVLPGWGQLYRGHRKRAYAVAGVTVAAAAYWFMADRDYQNAYNAYRSTQIGELDLGSRTGTEVDVLPYRDRFENAKSKASRANMALGILAGVWLAGVFDHVIIGPAHLEVGIPVF